jgi:hypothetical protein
MRFFLLFSIIDARLRACTGWRQLSLITSSLHFFRSTHSIGLSVAHHTPRNATSLTPIQQ